MNWRRIVVGVDFSEASLAAVRWVATEFAPDAEVILVHVESAPRIPSWLPGEFEPSPDGRIAVPSAVYGGLRGLADLVGAGRSRVRLRAGEPADALIQVAREVQADLVCVGRGRRRRGGARFGATTSQRVLSRNRLPTLIVPPVRLAAPTRVLVAIDERAGGRRVLEAARRIGDAHEAHVAAVHVIEKELLDLVIAHEPFKSRRGSQRYGPEGAGAWLRERARDWVVAEMQETGAGRHGASLVVQIGDAGPQIIRHAQETIADVIVLGGGAGRGNSRSAFPVGSTARMVAWAAPCPTLLVPTEAVVLTPSTRGGRSVASLHGLSTSTSNSTLPGGDLAS